MRTEDINIFSKGWNYSQDGPGNRLIYHFQGCNLSCPWYSNPEGIAISGTLLVNPDKLIDSVCPYGSIHEKKLDRKKCHTCTQRICINKNRNEGIRLSAQAYSLDEILDEVENAATLFHSGGGITITGGEATLQFNVLKQLLLELKKRKIHTTIETNGTHNRLSELFDLTDILIIDLKHPDSPIHKSILGLDNETIIKNIQKASESGIELWIRIPLIPDFNDTEEVIKQFISIIKKINRENVSVELLSYHEYGKIKWEQSGLTYIMPNKRIPVEVVRKYEQQFRTNNIRIINT